ncbi:MAG: hypothetical protein WCI04_02305 [archaeon]
MINNKKFIENLSCEELEIIARKKRDENNSKSTKLLRLAEREMRNKFCEPYK